MRFYLTDILLRRVPFISRVFRGYTTWMLFDIPIILVAFVFALFGRSFTTVLDIKAGLLFTLFVLAAFLFANHLMGNYRRYWSYAASHDIISIFAASMSATASILVIELFITPRPLPYSVVLAGGFFSFAGMTAIRYRRRLFSGMRWALRSSLLRDLADGKSTLILGAGESGQALAYHIQMSAAGGDHYLIGFLDDHPEKIGKLIHGLPVLGRCEQVAEIVENFQVELIIIALHNIPPKALHQMIERCMQTSAQIRLLPDPLSSLNGSAGLPALREVTLDELIGRPPVAVDAGSAMDLLRGQRVLVTGAAGSIGSELSRQIAQAGPAQLILLDNNESALHEIVLELRHTFSSQNLPDPLKPVVGDVTHAADMDRIFRKHQPQHIFHAAAYKHVYWMEQFPLQAIRTNVLGTHTILQACLRFGAEHFLLVSSDKAADPTSIMGATKRLCEMLTLFPETGGENMSRAAVRFGNVLGSRGSVVPTFERQIAAGGPVTVTDPQMRRFFMTISEAVTLLLLANSLTRGRDLFMLEIGDEVSILGLAKRMMRLRGLRPETDIPVVFTGIGKGEKLSEQLLGAGEEWEPTDIEGIRRVRVASSPFSGGMAQVIDAFQEYSQTGDEEAALALLWSAVDSPLHQPLDSARLN